MEKFFKAALGIGGLGTVGAAVFWSLYKEWITLDIFSQLSADQTFVIMILFLILIFMALIALVIAHIFKNVVINKATASNGSISVINTSGDKK